MKKQKSKPKTKKGKSTPKKKVEKKEEAPTKVEKPTQKVEAPKRFVRGPGLLLDIERQQEVELNGKKYHKLKLSDGTETLIPEADLPGQLA